MRISDWSSDVCSADLRARQYRRRFSGGFPHALDQGFGVKFSNGIHSITIWSRWIRAPLGVYPRIISWASERCPASFRASSMSYSASPRAIARLSRSEEHTSELQSLMRTSYAVYCLKKKKKKNNTYDTNLN